MEFEFGAMFEFSIVPSAHTEKSHATRQAQIRGKKCAGKPNLDPSVFAIFKMAVLEYFVTTHFIFTFALLFPSKKNMVAAIFDPVKV